MIADRRHWALMSQPITQAVDTYADTEPLSREPNEKFASQWAAAESQLIDWGVDPSQLDEDGTVTPTRTTIRQAIQFANHLNTMGFPGPTRVVPDIRGGIVFEFVARHGGAVSYRIHPDSKIELRMFDGNRLALRVFLGP